MTLESKEDQQLKEYFSRLQSLLPSDILGKVEAHHSKSGRKSNGHAYSSQESLKERLQSKISELKLKRKAGAGDPQKIKKQKKHLKEKLKQVNTTLPSSTNQKSSKNSDSTNHSNNKQIKKEYNKDNRILYSKFDLIDRNDDPTILTEYKKNKQDKKSKHKFGEVGALTGKNYKKLLKINEAKTAQLQALTETDPEKARALKDKDRWHTALLKSEGVKVKDNIQLLKKAAKRQEKIKNTKKKRWEERIAKVDDDKEKKQLKRKENLNKRSEEKRKKKTTRSIKKGRYLPELNNHT